MSVDESLGLDDIAHLERMRFGMARREDAADIGWSLWEGQVVEKKVVDSFVSA
jgi:hypothetical protein